jgi:hypothetical protein
MATVLLWLVAYYDYWLTMATDLLWLVAYYGYWLTKATKLLWPLYSVLTYY